MANRNIQMVYQAFLNAGLSPQQARAITAEVGRENDFNSKYVFGRHVDSANSKTNLGFLSWQGSRGRNLDKRLRSKGLIDRNGNIVRNQQALNEMAKFAIEEIRTNPSYRKTKTKFLDNPNVDYNTAKQVLGKNFIRWDYDGNSIGKAQVKKHHAKRDRYYAQLGGVTGETQQGPVYSPVQGSSDTFNIFETKKPSSIFGDFTQNLIDSAYDKVGVKTPVLNVDGQMVVPENAKEHKLFGEIADMGLPPEEESAKAKSVGLISKVENSLTEESLFGYSPIMGKLSQLFKNI